MTPDDAQRDQSSGPRLAAGVRLQTDRLTGHPVLLFPEGMLKLNPTGAAILELCDGHHSADDVVVSLASRFSAPPDVLRADVNEYIERLIRRGLLEPAPPAVGGTKGGP